MAEKRYTEAKGARSVRLVTGSDDFTMYLWDPDNSKKPLARMTGKIWLLMCSEHIRT